MTAPVSPEGGDRIRWSAMVRAALTERLGVKLVAALLAVLLWVVVGARQPTEGYVPVRVVPELDSSLVLLDGPPQLRALVTGRAADLVKLYAVPPVVRRVVGGDAPDTLMLDVTPGDVRLPPELVNLVRIVDVQPRSVALRFETRATRRVPVLDDGRILVLRNGVASRAPAVGFDPGFVRVTGPRRQVRALRGVYPLSLTIADGDSLPHLADLDTASLNLRIHPAQVRVTIAGPTGRAP